MSVNLDQIDEPIALINPDDKLLITKDPSGSPSTANEAVGEVLRDAHAMAALYQAPNATVTQALAADTPTPLTWAGAAGTAKVENRFTIDQVSGEVVMPAKLGGLCLAFLNVQAAEASGPAHAQEFRFGIEVDTGAGYAAVPGALASIICESDLIAGVKSAVASASLVLPITLADGDKIRCYVQANSTSATLLMGYGHFTLIRIGDATPAP